MIRSKTFDKLFEQNILGFEIAMDEMGFVQKAESVQELLCEDTNECCAQSAELILLDEFVEIDTE